MSKYRLYRAVKTYANMKTVATHDDDMNLDEDDGNFLPFASAAAVESEDADFDSVIVVQQCLTFVFCFCV